MNRLCYFFGIQNFLIYHGVKLLKLPEQYMCHHIFAESKDCLWVASHWFSWEYINSLLQLKIWAVYVHLKKGFENVLWDICVSSLIPRHKGTPRKQHHYIIGLYYRYVKRIELTRCMIWHGFCFSEVFKNLLRLTRIFHVCEAFICKAFKGAAVVDYCKPLITKQMGASNSPTGWKFLRNWKGKFSVKTVTLQLEAKLQIMNCFHY